MVAISVLAIGVASAVGALTKFNSIASISRNATGAYAAVMNQIDLIQSDAPFNPGKKNPDGWSETGKSGSKEECLSYIEEVWVDMRPLSLRGKLQGRS